MSASALRDQGGGRAVSMHKAEELAPPGHGSITTTLLFFYRPRTLNRFRVQGAPIGRLIIIGRLIDFEPKMVIFHGFPLIFQGI